MYLEKVNNPTDLKNLTAAELKLYAAEARQFIIDAVNKNGGHLASNLGAVELTIALHYSFNSPADKIIWDVGHQSYTHKLITGRRESFDNLRGSNGVSGFPCTAESEHDQFTSGHSSNSLSLAAGLAKARDLNNETHHIIPVIGDGAFTGGMVYEALNDIGESQSKIIIILNDNKMSISKNVGAMSKYFARLRLSLKYNKVKQNIKKGLSALPFVDNDAFRNSSKWKIINGVKMRLRNLVMANRLFENFGIMYYGPFDGHNISEMLEVFRKVSLQNKPVIIHLITQKGRGCEKAECSPDKFHGLSAPETDTGKENEKNYSEILGKTLIEMATKDYRIAAITAAMPSGTGLEEFAHRFPKRYFDVSIAEQHAVTMCAGLAKGGVKPFFAVYSTFLQRGFDQILHDVCLNNLPVTFAIDRAGAVGSDGVTHQGIFDISYLNLVPNMTIVAPKDGTELKQFLLWAKDFNAPLAIRYPKSYINNYTATQCQEIEYGKWEWLKKTASQIFILAAGNRMLDLAFCASRARQNIESHLRKKEDKDINIINVRFIKPLDFMLLDEINKEGNLILTLEDNVKSGGLGEAVLSYCNPPKANFKILSHPDCFLDNRNIEQSLIQSGLSCKNINSIINSFLK